MSKFIASGIINERVRPRILLWVSQDKQLPAFDWLEAKAGTFRHIRSLDDVDLSEWDVLVTPHPHATIADGQYGNLNHWDWRRTPETVYVFRVFPPSVPLPGRSFFEFDLLSDNDANDQKALKLGSRIPGHSMNRVDSLPEAVQELVKSSLLPAVEGRDFQFGIEKTREDLAPAVLDLRPFLVGPSGLIMAASYKRPGGKGVWLVPNDVADLSRWFDVAISEWHVSDPQTFPTVSSWQTSPQWDTAAEREAREQLQVLNDNFLAATAAFEKARDEAGAAFQRAATVAQSGAKALLTSQDDALQNAVFAALVHLGFEVTDMDDVWSERERREDYRIRDPDDKEWLVLGDATGVAKGAPGSKITSLAGYITKYVLDEKPSSAPGIWVIVNRLFYRDPLTRGDIYRADELAVLESQAGLAIDSAALFLLTQHIPQHDDRARSCRAWLRSQFGQITAQDALNWIGSNPQAI